MTNPAIAEQQSRAPRSPYEAETMSSDRLGLPSHIAIHAERWVEPITDLDRAGEVYREHGAVILDPDCVVRMGDEDVRVGDFTKAAGEYTLDQLRDHPEIIQKKKYGAYNDTNRNLFVIKFAHVNEFLPEVTNLQQALLPTVRRINGDPSTEISTDEHEGTVVNLQLFHKDGDAAEKQEHGAHTDRVDTTTIVCMDNVGPKGELVFVQGYTAVCKRLGLSPHRGFNHNIADILEHAPNALTFRIHDVRPGTIVMVRSADDVHFITAKTLGDVQRGDHEPDVLTVIDSKNKQIAMGMGRGIINMAFETGECRAVDKRARDLEARFPAIAEATTNDARFDALDEALSTIEDIDERAAIANAIVTRFSADDLYDSDKLHS